MAGKVNQINRHLKSDNVPSFMKVEPKIFEFNEKKKTVKIEIPPSPQGS